MPTNKDLLVEIRDIAIENRRDIEWLKEESQRRLTWLEAEADKNMVARVTVETQGDQIVTHLENHKENKSFRVSIASIFMSAVALIKALTG